VVDIHCARIQHREGAGSKIPEYLERKSVTLCRYEPCPPAPLPVAARAASGQAEGRQPHHCLTVPADAKGIGCRTSQESHTSDPSPLGYPNPAEPSEIASSDSLMGLAGLLWGRVDPTYL
jgi:hypothetical protein